MTVPYFQSMMLPILKILGDLKEHSMSEISEALAKQFALSDEERRELLPTGKQTRLENRVGWARTYLKKAGLLDITGIGKVRITDQGAQVLASNPLQIDAKFLQQFPGFLEFKKKQEKEQTTADSTSTPREAMEAHYRTINTQLVEDILERMRSCSSSFFEKLVVDLLVAMDYGGSRKDAGQAIGQSGDGGIDGIIKEDKLGLDAVYIQAKRWEGSVGSPIVRNFVGSLEANKASKGVLITTSQFSKDAKDLIPTLQKRIVLIDGEKLAQLMIEHDIGVTPEDKYEIKRVDLDYFTGEQ